MYVTNKHLIFSAMLTDAFNAEDVGIALGSRTDGGFYKPQRLKADIQKSCCFLLTTVPSAHPVRAKCSEWWTYLQRQANILG